jgi:hypothetical protein
MPMEVLLKKLGPEEALRLVRVPWERLHPYELMPAPAYVWMKKNQKFLLLKQPLDFLSQSEFDRHREWGELYFPTWIDQVQRARDFGAAVRALLHFHPRSARGSELQPWSSFERNDGVVRTMASLWGQPLAADPFFLCHFVDRVCDPISADAMQSVREQSVAKYEQALYRSSWGVTLALLLGFGDLAWISRWRQKLFTDESLLNTEERDLHGWVQGTLPDTHIRSLRAELFDQAVGRVGERLRGRMQRIRDLVPSLKSPPLTLLENSGVQFG